MIHSWYIWKDIFTKIKKFKKKEAKQKQITADAIYVWGKFAKVYKFCPLSTSKTLVIGECVITCFTSEWTNMKSLLNLNIFLAITIHLQYNI